MKKILILILSLGAFTAYAQDVSSDRQKIADETTLETMKSGKVKVITSNETISKKLITHYSKCQCIAYTFRYKKDRMGTYGEWAITLPADKKQEVITALK